MHICLLSLFCKLHNLILQLSACYHYYVNYMVLSPNLAHLPAIIILQITQFNPTAAHVGLLLQLGNLHRFIAQPCTSACYHYSANYMVLSPSLAHLPAIIILQITQFNPAAAHVCLLSQLGNLHRFITQPCTSACYHYSANYTVLSCSIISLRFTLFLATAMQVIPGSAMSALAS